MYLNTLLLYDKIESLRFSDAVVEYPVYDILNYDWKNILQPPPKNTSKTTLKELKVISAKTLSRSNTDIAIVNLIDQDIDAVFKDLLSKYNIEYPQKYIDLFYTISRPILKNIKGFWNRPRPYQLAEFYDIEIDVIYTETHHTASYPSGHTVYSKLIALILTDLYPIIPQSKLNKIVDVTANARIMQGVHYPSDNNASLILANSIYKKLQPKLKGDYYGKIS